MKKEFEEQTLNVEEKVIGVLRDRGYCKEGFLTFFFVFSDFGSSGLDCCLCSGDASSCLVVLNFPEILKEKEINQKK